MRENWPHELLAWTGAPVQVLLRRSKLQRLIGKAVDSVDSTSHASTCSWSPMKSIYIEGLGNSATRNVTCSFVVVDKHLRKTNRGKPYLSLILADRTGQVEARVWHNAEHAFGCFEPGNVIEVVAKIEHYKNKLQLIVERLRRRDPNAVELADYPPGTSGAPDDFSTLAAFASEIEEWVDCDIGSAAELATAQKIEALKAKYSGSTLKQSPPATERQDPATCASRNRLRTSGASDKLAELKRKFLGAVQETDDF